jgi:hypothetical protein
VDFPFHFPFPYGTALSIIVAIITGAKQSHYDFSEVWDSKRFEYTINAPDFTILDNRIFGYKTSENKIFHYFDSETLEAKKI